MDTKLNMETVDAVDGVKNKQAVCTQNTFRRTIRNAESGIGMKVNTNKTNLLCISDSLTFKAEAFIRAEDGTP